MEITIQQAADKLGVTPCRVRQLIYSGQIKARHLTPRMLLIDTRELAKVRKRNKPGRPAKNKGR